LAPQGGGSYSATGQTQFDSTITPDYTASEQIQQASRGIAALIDAIRTAKNNKEIARLRVRAAENAVAIQKLLAAGTSAHLETSAPMAPGARRSGAVAFVRPKNSDSPTVKVILVVSDPNSRSDQFIAFQFR
jgi:hypothetical protein